MLLVYESSKSESRFYSFSSWHLIQIDGIKEKTGITIDDEIYETKFPITYILLFLKGKDHAFKSSKAFGKIKIFTINIDHSFVVSTKLQAVDNDRKPWMKLILANTPLFKVYPFVKTPKRSS